MIYTIRKYQVSSIVSTTLINCNFFFLLSSRIKRRGEEREKTNKKNKNDLGGISRLRQQPHYYRYKYLDETSPATPKKITNDKRRGPHEPSNGIRAHLPLSYSYGLLRSPLVIFLDIIVLENNINHILGPHLIV
jgi:hypothetical protein